MSTVHNNVCQIKIIFFTDGTQIETEESKILGKILPKLTSLQVDGLDLDIEKLIEGTSTVTYEELQIVLGRSAQTLYLSTDLEKKLRERKHSSIIIPFITSFTMNCNFSNHACTCMYINLGTVVKMKLTIIIIMTVSYEFSLYQSTFNL